MDRAQRLSLLAAIMGSFVVGLDSTVVSVALPAIEEDLGGGLAGQQWVSNGYLLALAALILVGGSLGDVYGERRVFSLGVLGFGMASIVCALAPSIEVLVAGRVLQGVFGALLTPSALAVIVTAFPPAQRGAAVGSWLAWSGIAAVVGPLVGGQLIDSASWRWIFAINAPFVVVVMVLVAMAVPQRPRLAARPPVDWLGAALSFLALAGPTLALIRQPESGWGAPDVLVPGLGGLALFGAFLWREATTPHPMLPLELFKRRNFTAGNLQTFAMYAGLSILFFYLVLFLQQVAGYTALEAGFATLPTTVVIFLLSKRAGALADRYGARWFMGGGGLVAAAGLVGMLRLDADVDYVTRAPAGAPAVLGRAGGDRRAADRDGARRRRRGARRDRLGRQQRGRPRGGAARHRRARRRGRGPVHRLAGRAARRRRALAARAGRRAGGQVAHAGARRRLGTSPAGGGEHRAGHRGGRRVRVPHRHGDQRRARRPRRRPGARARARAPPRGQLRRLRGRPARGRAGRRRARAPAGRRSAGAA